MTRRGKKRLVVLVTVVVGVTVLLAGAHELRLHRRAQMAATAYENGLASYRHGDYTAALPELAFAVSRGYDDFDTLMVRADCRLHVPAANGGHQLLAARFYRQAADADPSNPEPLLRLLEIYHRITYLTERLETAEQLMKLDAHSAPANLARIETLLRLGRPEQAGQAADAYLAIVPTSYEALQMRLQALSYTGASESELITFIESVAADYADDAGVALLHCETLMRLGRRVQAVTAMERALTLPIVDDRILQRLVTAMDALAMTEQADALLERMSHDGHTHPELEAFMIERAWKSNAIDIARAYADAHSVPNTVIDEITGWRAFLNVDQASDVSLIDQTVPESPVETDTSGYWKALIRGRLAERAGKPVEARASLLSALAYRPDDEIPLLLLGRIDSQMGERERAIAYLEAVVRTDPNWVEPQILLASTYLDSGRVDQAVASAQRAFSNHPNAGHALLLAHVLVESIASGYGGVEAIRETLNILSTLQDVAPDHAEVLAILARAYVLAGQPDRALAILPRIMAGASAIDLQNLLVLYEALAAAGEPEAESLLQYLNTRADLDPQLISIMAERSIEAGRPDEAIAKFDGAISRCTDRDRVTQLMLSQAVFMDRHQMPGAHEALAMIARERQDDAQVQRAVLESVSVWTDETLVVETIARLRAVVGDDAMSWMVFQAQQKLAFEPDETRATEVIQLLEPILRVHPHHLQSLLLTTEAYLTLKDSRNAIRLLSLAVDAYPNRYELYPRLIGLLRHEGRSSEMQRRLLQFAQQTIPMTDMSAHRERISLLLSGGLWAEATREAELLAANDDSMDRRLLAQIYARRGRTDDADAILTGLLAHPDADPETVLAAAALKAQTGQFEAGRQLIADRYVVIPAWRAQVALGRYFETYGRIDEAASVFAALREHADPDAVVEAARFYLRNQQYETAQQMVSQALLRHQDSATLSVLATLLDAMLGRSLAPEEIDQIAAAFVDPSEQEAFRVIAAVENWRHDHPDETSEYLTRLTAVTQAHPQVIGAWTLLVTALREAGQGTEAVKMAQLASQTLPQSIGAARLETLALLAAERWEDAYPAACRWQELASPSSVEPDIAVAVAEVHTGRSASGFARLKHGEAYLIANARSQSHVFLIYVGLLLERNDVPHARQLLAPLIEDAAWRCRAVLIASRLSSTQQARLWIEDMEALCASSDDEHLALAVAWCGFSARVTDPTDGLRRARAHLLAIREPTVASLMYLADVESGLGDVDEAISAYRRALALDANNAIALNNLACLLRDQSRDLSEAETSARKAVALAVAQQQPEERQADLLDTLGSILLAQNNYAEARSIYERAISCNHSAPALELQYINVLVTLGEFPAAGDRLRTFEDRFAKSDLPAEVAAQVERLRARLVSG